MTTASYSSSTGAIRTKDLLAAVGDHGADWPAEFPEHGVEALAAALAREMGAGNIDDGGCLTSAGRDVLNRVNGERSAAYDTATAHSLTSPSEQWR